MSLRKWHIVHQLDPGKIADWPLLAQLVGTGVCAGIILLLGYLVVLDPFFAHLEASQQQAAQLAQTRRKKQLMAGGLRQEEQQLLGLRNRTHASLRATVTPLLTLIHRTALLRRLYIERLQPEPPIARGDLNERALQLTLSGEYHDLVDFANDMALLPYLVSLDKLRLCYNKEGRLILNAQLKAVETLSPNNIDPASSFPRSIVPDFVGDPNNASEPAHHLPAQRYPNPFAPKQYQPQTGLLANHTIPQTQQALQNHEIDTLDFVGMVAQGTKRWALVRAPDGRVHSLKPGSFIGPRYGQIVAISEHMIVIEARIEDESSPPKRIYLPLSRMKH